MDSEAGFERDPTIKEFFQRWGSTLLHKMMGQESVFFCPANRPLLANVPTRFIVCVHWVRSKKESYYVVCISTDPSWHTIFELALTGEDHHIGPVRLWQWWHFEVLGLSAAAANDFLFRRRHSLEESNLRLTNADKQTRKWRRDNVLKSWAGSEITMAAPNCSLS